MRPQDFVNNVRTDGSASYLELNPEPSRLSSRSRGWDGIVVEQDRFYPFENGEVTYDEHILGVVLDERAQVSLGVAGVWYEGLCGPGDLLLCPAGRPVRWRLEGVWEGLVLALHPEVIRRVASDLDLDASKVELIPHPRHRDALVAQIGQSLLTVLREPSLGERLYVESLRNALAIHLLRHYSSLSRRARERSIGRGLPGVKLRRAIDAIQENLEGRISIGQLAETAGVSASHFEVLFKQSTGLSPYQYLLRCRVDRAKQLLRDEGLSLVQVAARVGFCDQGHLSRHFKKFVGITPSGYRKGS